MSDIRLHRQVDGEVAIPRTGILVSWLDFTRPVKVWATGRVNARFLGLADNRVCVSCPEQSALPDVAPVRAELERNKMA